MTLAPGAVPLATPLQRKRLEAQVTLLEQKTREERGGWKNALGSRVMDAFSHGGYELERAALVARGQLSLAQRDGQLTLAEAQVVARTVAEGSRELGGYRALKHTTGKVVGTLAAIGATMPVAGAPLAAGLLGAGANVAGNFAVRGNEYQASDVLLDGAAGGGAGALGAVGLKLGLGAKLAARVPDRIGLDGAARVGGDSVGMAVGWTVPMDAFQESTWREGVAPGALRIVHDTAKSAAMGFGVGAVLGAVTAKVNATKGGALGLAREIGEAGAPSTGLALGGNAGSSGAGLGDDVANLLGSADDVALAAGEAASNGLAEGAGQVRTAMAARRIGSVSGASNGHHDEQAKRAG